jgi:2-dehydropantoate 2-reductase
MKQSGVWHIVGSGAVGCLLSARLSQAGHNQCKIINRKVNSLQTIRIKDSFPGSLQNQVNQVQVEAQTALGSSAPIERVMIATKAFDARSAVESISHRLKPNATIVVLCNGMGVIESLPSSSYRVLAGVNSHGCFKTGDWDVVHSGIGQIQIGAVTAQDKECAMQVVEDIRMGHKLDISFDKNILKRMYLKLCANACINALTALFDCRNGELLNQPIWSDEIVEKLISEIHWLAEALDSQAKICAGPMINVTKEELKDCTMKVLVQAQNNFSSMCMDVRNKRRTEVDFINGYIVNMSKRLGGEAPFNQLLAESVKLKSSILQKRVS